MLDGRSSPLAHRLQNVAFLFLSAVFLPFDSLLLFTSALFNALYPSQLQNPRRHHARQNLEFKERTILVTGVGMTKGLALARLFYEAGHDVVGADFEPDGALVCGRVSRSLKKFYRLQRPNAQEGTSPYLQSLLDVITKEKVDLWVSCSGVASAVEDGMAKEIVEARTACKAIQFDVETTQKLHEKHSFMQYTKEIGLNIPDTRAVTSRAAVEKFLRSVPPGRKYIMKTIGMDDSVRADMTLLPRSTDVETARHIARLKISEQAPWILQQFIKGKEYCTHALVIKGKVKAFVACPSAELLMHYEALPFQSPLSQAMLKFTEHFATSGGADFTGHLSFDFMAEDGEVSHAKDITLYPIECNPRAHTAVALFNGRSSMVDAYLSVFDSTTATTTKDAIVPPATEHKYYWIGHDVVTHIIIPTLSFLSLDLSLSDLMHNYSTFSTHLLTWKDGTFELWDPLPWWWLYHLYWPMRFLSCLGRGRKWSRVNVSTTKMFDC